MRPPTAEERHGASPPAVSMATVRTLMPGPPAYPTDTEASPARPRHLATLFESYGHSAVSVAGLPAASQPIDITAPARSQRITASRAVVGSETHPAVPRPVSTWKKIA